MRSQSVISSLREKNEKTSDCPLQTSRVENPGSTRAQSHTRCGHRRALRRGSKAFESAGQAKHRPLSWGLRAATFLGGVRIFEVAICKLKRRPRRKAVLALRL